MHTFTLVLVAICCVISVSTFPATIEDTKIDAINPVVAASEDPLIKQDFQPGNAEPLKMSGYRAKRQYYTNSVYHQGGYVLKRVPPHVHTSVVYREPGRRLRYYQPY